MQPLRQMNGYASFNQVFLTDAKVEPEFLVSEVGNGWAVTTTTLMHERRGADGLRSWAIASDKPGRAYDEEREEIRTTMEPYKWYPQRAGRALFATKAKHGQPMLGDSGRPAILELASWRRNGEATLSAAMAATALNPEPTAQTDPFRTFGRDTKSRHLQRADFPQWALYDFDSLPEKAQKHKM
jgi:hypothetical protein